MCIGPAEPNSPAPACGTIRLKVLKIGALVTRSIRRIRIAPASSCPDAAAVHFAQVRLC
jgi:hypothetical protein